MLGKTISKIELIELPSTTEITTTQPLTTIRTKTTTHSPSTTTTTHMKPARLLSSTSNIYIDNSNETVIEIPFVAADWKSSGKMSENTRKSNDIFNYNNHQDGRFLILIRNFKKKSNKHYNLFLVLDEIQSSTNYSVDAFSTNRPNKLLHNNQNRTKHSKSNACFI